MSRVDQRVIALRLLPHEFVQAHTSDFDAVTHDLFHQPTLDENDIAEQLVIEPFFEGASYAER